MTARRCLRVVAGVLERADGAVLLAQRTAPKAYAGQWEFPGGKCERDEGDAEALARELREELGVRLQSARPLIEVHHDYPEFSVQLAVWRVGAWGGEPRALEGQPLAWVGREDLPAWPLLAADRPILTALRLPAGYAITPPELDAGSVLAACGALPAGLLRLRLPGLGDAAYADLAERVAAVIGGQRLVLDRGPELSARLGCGWHAAARRLDQPLPVTAGVRIASVHDADELARARAAGFDAVTLSPVRATASHPQAKALGWEGFARLARGANLPVYALGGLGPSDCERAWAAGGQGVAGIRGFWPAECLPKRALPVAESGVRSGS